MGDQILTFVHRRLHEFKAMNGLEVAHDEPALTPKQRELFENFYATQGPPDATESLFLARTVRMSQADVNKWCK